MDGWLFLEWRYPYSRRRSYRTCSADSRELRHGLIGWSQLAVHWYIPNNDEVRCPSPQDSQDKSFLRGYIVQMTGCKAWQQADQSSLVLDATDGSEDGLMTIGPHFTRRSIARSQRRRKLAEKGYRVRKSLLCLSTVR